MLHITGFEIIYEFSEKFIFTEQQRRVFRLIFRRIIFKKGFPTFTTFHFSLCWELRNRRIGYKIIIRGTLAFGFTSSSSTLRLDRSWWKLGSTFLGGTNRLLSFQRGWPAFLFLKIFWARWAQKQETICSFRRRCSSLIIVRGGTTVG